MRRTPSLAHDDCVAFSCSPGQYCRPIGGLLTCGDCILNRSTWNLRCATLSKRRCRLRSLDAESSHTVDLTVTPWKLAKPAGMAADELLLSAFPATAAASSQEALWESCIICMPLRGALAAPWKRQGAPIWANFCHLAWYTTLHLRLSTPRALHMATRLALPAIGIWAGLLTTEGAHWSCLVY